MQDPKYAMQTEPPEADAPKRKRRWFQFSLRTLMIGVTMLAVPLGNVGWQAKIVRQRQAMLDEIKDRGGRFWTVELVRGLAQDQIRQRLIKNTDWPDTTIPLVRRWLGDDAIVWIGLPPNEPLWDECHAAFPEALIQRVSPAPRD
jgi:hypothetical protein